MKYFLILTCLFFTLCVNAQLMPNNLAVLKVVSTNALQGGGGTGTSQITRLVEYTTAGVATATDILMTGSGNTKFVVEDRPIAHEGQLNLSEDRMYVTTVGYNNNPGQTASVIRAGQKVVARIDGGGNLDTTTYFIPAFIWNGSNVRSAISIDGNNYWVSSGTTVRTVDHGTLNGSPFSSSTFRSLMRHGGVLYGTSQGSSNISIISEIDGSNTLLPIVSVATPEYCQFVFLDAYPSVDYNGTGFDLLYIADRNSGLRKFYWNATTSLWTPVTATGLFNPIVPGTNQGGFFGLTARMEFGKPTLYGIRNDGSGTATHVATHILKVVDNSINSNNVATLSSDWNIGSTTTLLASTGNNEMFRGICFTPLSAETVVPIKLVSFTGSLVGNSANLKWQTSSEINASKYIIEKSLNSTDFSVIGEVAANNVERLSNYSFVQQNINNGFSYYRLKLIDKDGKFTYSRTIVIRLDVKQATGITIFPNPVINNAVITHPLASENTFLRVLSTEGRLLAQYILTKNATQTSIDLSAIGKGVYILNYASNQNNYSTKFIK